MPTAGELHPTEGIRMLLELEAKTGETATYRATLFTPDSAFEYRAELELGGGAELSAVSEPASEDNEKRLVSLARSTARSAERKAAEGLNPWPDRLLRWRK